METVLLDTPSGIDARLAWDPRVSEHDRRRVLSRELVSERLGIDAKTVRVEREAPTVFGHHTQLFAELDGAELPLQIRTTSFRAATIVAVADPGITIGIDLRDSHLDKLEAQEMHRHSHLWDGSSEADFLRHWVHVKAVIAADGRGTRVRPEAVRLDTGLNRGWIPDRPARYNIADVSRNGFLITIAYAQPAA
ncbi:4'-phosphopantetheinyl transferase [Microbacterium endophyticum]|uniref:4'-phosphopantetheinyl transferase n=1 Tax=Microbacterium endophyticum TaxID=1526412 RepID=A0A7W4V321_9MICO|nr:hypothetical protein [Microbacterium endophyticum]MBB2975962.1 4'-phosphopantetheinyl transferase [Microbacterium endophyticum]NIK37669.1 4'-phosphopantetheinyl transferase [Microbacterium endophyticum]